ncbi:MAG: T9SS type A sorting domain-containing protein [Candidatus Electryonea clarkiae]|nr:T9SS type A sorting domain-containing protein [Candidatus Electryonea clarkiae]MDP8288294.1 T9SS type A sorting domain-containing protein [Candidatus Electryonea clarkiae]
MYCQSYVREAVLRKFLPIIEIPAKSHNRSSPILSELITVFLFSFLCFSVFLAVPPSFAQDSLGIRVLDKYETYSSFIDVDFIEDYTLIAAGWSGLLVVSGIEDEDPEIVGQYGEDDEFIWTVMVSENRALTIGTYLTLYDISDPLNIESVSRVEIPSLISDRKVIWQGDRIISYQMHEIAIYEYQENGDTELLQTISIDNQDSRLEDIDLWDNYIIALYVIEEEGSLFIWDITDLENIPEPYVIDGITDNQHWGDLSVEDGIAAVTLGSTLRLIDINPPESSEIIAFYNHHGRTQLYCPVINGHNIFTFSFDFRSAPIINSYRLNEESDLVLSDYAFLTYVNTYLQGMKWHEGAMFQIEESQGLKYVPVNDEGEFGEVYTWDPVDDFRNAVKLGEMLIFNNGWENLSLFDGNLNDELILRDIFNPEGMRSSHIIASNDDVGLLYTTSANPETYYENEFYLITPDHDNPQTIELGGLIQTSNATYLSTIQNDILYTRNHGHFCDIIDISDVDNPEVVSSFEMATNAGQMQLFSSENCLLVLEDYVLYSYHQITIYDISDPLEPVQVSSIDSIVPYQLPKLDDGFLFLKDENYTWTVYSLEDPANPEIVMEIEHEEAVGQVLDYFNGFLLTSNYHDGDEPVQRIEVYDLNDFEEAELVAQYPITRSPGWGELQDDRIIVSWGHGIGLFEWEPMGAEERQVSSLPIKPALNIYPNPANPDAILTFDLPQNALLKIDMYDLLGRHISQLADNTFKAGNHKFHIDGRNIQSSGIYYIKAQTDNWSETRKFVMLK